MSTTKRPVTDIAVVQKRGRPSKRDLSKRPENRCTALSRTTGDQCGKRAGWGTDHVGAGMCRIHGGSTPTPTHIVSEYGIDTLVERYINDPRIFDLRKDIATLRAMRDLEIVQFGRTYPGSQERDSSIYKLSGIINGIVKASREFFDLVNRRGFALTVSQFRQLREATKKITFEEGMALSAILAKASPELVPEIEAWSHRFAERLKSELQVESETPLDDDS